MTPHEDYYSRRPASGWGPPFSSAWPQSPSLASWSSQISVDGVGTCRRSRHVR